MNLTGRQVSVRRRGLTDAPCAGGQVIEARVAVLVGRGLEGALSVLECRHARPLRFILLLGFILCPPCSELDILEGVVITVLHGLIDKNLGGCVFGGALGKDESGGCVLVGEREGDGCAVQHVSTGSLDLDKLVGGASVAERKLACLGLSRGVRHHVIDYGTARDGRLPAVAGDILGCAHLIFHTLDAQPIFAAGLYDRGFAVRLLVGELDHGDRILVGDIDGDILAGEQIGRYGRRLVQVVVAHLERLGQPDASLVVGGKDVDFRMAGVPDLLAYRCPVRIEQLELEPGKVHTLPGLRVDLHDLQAATTLLVVDDVTQPRAVGHLICGDGPVVNRRDPVRYRLGHLMHGVASYIEGNGASVLV